ncbi:e1.2 [Tranosema rostrale ichnovirus]|nr:e1.2 [Tranosema rostrale ichnovirus]
MYAVLQSMIKLAVCSIDKVAFALRNTCVAVELDRKRWYLRVLRQSHSHFRLHDYAARFTHTCLPRAQLTLHRYINLAYTPKCHEKISRWHQSVNCVHSKRTSRRLYSVINLVVCIQP